MAPAAPVDDAVLGIVQIVATVAALDAVQAQALERAIRHTFGGEQVYITRMDGQTRAQRSAAAVEALTAGASVRDVARRYGLARSQVGRLRRRVSPARSP